MAAGRILSRQLDLGSKALKRLRSCTTICGVDCLKQSILQRSLDYCRSISELCFCAQSAKSEVVRDSIYASRSRGLCLFSLGRLLGFPFSMELLGQVGPEDGFESAASTF